MSDHPVRRKLRGTVIPYVVSAKRLRKQPIYIAHWVHVYTNDLLAAMIGLGLANPVLRLFSGEDASAAQVMKSFGETAWAIPTIVAAVLWALFKIILTRQGAEKRAVLMRSCRTEFETYQFEITETLGAGDPLDGLNEIYERIMGTVKRHLAERAWPWPSGHAPDIDLEVDREVEALCRKYESGWAPPPENERN